MTEKVFKQVLPLVNDPEKYSFLCEYVKYRIEILRTYMETEVDPSKLRYVQGQIAELRRFLTLQDEAREKSR